jgi:hypothetical protein
LAIEQGSDRFLIVVKAEYRKCGQLNTGETLIREDENSQSIMKYIKESMYAERIEARDALGKKG